MNTKYLPIALLVASIYPLSGCAASASEEGASESAAVVAVPPTSANYERQSAAVKEQALWRNLRDSEYDERPEFTGLEPLQLLSFGVSPLVSLSRSFLDVTIHHNSDEMPERRVKGIHTYGSSATIKYIATAGQPFTGLFKGVDHGIARLSLAAKPGGGKSTPGLAIKFLIDGQPSKNFMAMYSLDGQEGFNFFENDFSNFVAPPQALPIKILAKGFSLVTSDPTKIDVSFLGTTEQNGAAVPSANAKGPMQIFLKPNKRELAFAQEEHDVRDDFATIKPGTVLYSVYANVPGAREAQEIGKIVTTSRFVSSSYGDERLFFRHEAIDKHLPANP
jgi:hypothetical protein